jgi:hypothetical protein
MAERSPNFPAVSLVDAIGYARLISEREGRSRMPRLSAAKALGYSGLNGRSLGALGALRAYGLLEGRGDDVSLTQDAITILKAPEGSDERNDALRRVFESPSAFSLLRAKGEASPETLKWHLIKSNFRDEAADKLLKVYLASRELVNAEAGAYDAFAPVEEKPEPNEMEKALSDFVAGKAQSPYPAAQKIIDDAKLEKESLAMGVHERILQSGMLSKHASYRVIVSGHVGEVEIGRLLRKLEMDKEILADQVPAMPEGYSDHEADGHND